MLVAVAAWPYLTGPHHSPAARRIRGDIDYVTTPGTGFPVCVVRGCFGARLLPDIQPLSNLFCSDVRGLQGFAMVSEAPDVIQDMAIYAILVPAGLIVLGIVYGIAMWGEHTVREWNNPSPSEAYHTGRHGPLGWNGHGSRRTYQGGQLPLEAQALLAPNDDDPSHPEPIPEGDEDPDSNEDAKTMVGDPDAASDITAVEGYRWKLRREGFSTTSRAGNSVRRTDCPPLDRRRGPAPRSMRGTVRIVDESGRERIIYPHNL